MSTSQRWQAALGGLGAFLVSVWPPVLIWRAAASGSVGDLPATAVLVLGLAYSVAVGAMAGVALVRALGWARDEPGVGRLDVWGGYVLGLGVYVVLLTALPLLVHALLFGEEGRTLADRFWMAALLWVAGHLAAAALGIRAGAAVLRRGARPDRTPAGRE